MKKKFFYSLAILAAVMMTAPMFVSCGDDDDDDDPNPGDKKAATVKVEYDVEFPDVVYQYCDVTLEYVDENGTVVRTAPLKNDFKKEMTVPAEKADRRYTVSASVALKKVYPTVDNNAVYEVGHDLEIEVADYDIKGTRLTFKNDESKSTMKIPGYNLLEYLGRMTTRDYSVGVQYPF